MIEGSLHRDFLFGMVATPRTVLDPFFVVIIAHVWVVSQGFKSGAKVAG